MTYHIYIGTCLTNLHVGNGDITYSVIDNEVSKDAVLDVPNIPGSGVKGAIREWAEKQPGIDIEYIFGKDTSKSSGKQQGSYKFFDAICISFPEPTVENSSLCQKGVEHHVEMLLKAIIGLKEKNFEIPFGKEVDDEQPFPSIPVLARNKLPDAEGKDGNLWYEEYVPHSSEFLFIIESDEDKDELELDKKVIQFGANASVGMGLIRLEEIK